MDCTFYSTRICDSYRLPTLPFPAMDHCRDVGKQLANINWVGRRNKPVLKADYWMQSILDWSVSNHKGSWASPWRVWAKGRLDIYSDSQATSEAMTGHFVRLRLFVAKSSQAFWRRVVQTYKDWTWWRGSLHASVVVEQGSLQNFLVKKF